MIEALLARGPRFLAILAALAGAIASISAAWGFQLIGGFIPCALCYAQRVPYYLGIPVLVVALAVSRRGDIPRLGSLLLLVAAAFFAYGAYLGAFQAGAEWGFWDGPRDCATSGAAAVTKAGDLLAAMAQTRIVSCTEVQLRIFGLSFAGWNVVVSAGLVGLCAFAALGRART